MDPTARRAVAAALVLILGLGRIAIAEPASDPNSSVRAVAARARVRGVPTDGLADPHPGPLALPAKIEGPLGVLRRVDQPGTGTRRGGLAPISAYVFAGERKDDLGGVWEIAIRQYDGPGQAHSRLYDQFLGLNSSGKRDAWKTGYERTSLPGLVYRYAPAVSRFTRGYFGVVRHVHVRIECHARRGETAGAAALAGRRDRAARVLAETLIATIVRADRLTIRTGDPRTLRGLAIERRKSDGRAVVRVDVGPEAAPDEVVRLWIGIGRGWVMRGGRASEVRKEPLTVLSRANEILGSGEDVVVLRVLPGNTLALEEYRLRIAADRSAATWKSPPR